MNDIHLTSTPSIGENATSHVPALELLRELGWTYISRDKALELRGGSTSHVLLQSTLKKQLEKINSVPTKNGDIPFSNEAINQAITKLSKPDDVGLIGTNETVWDLLRLGVSLQQTIDGRRRGLPFKYIDWDNLENNTFHVTEEFSVDRRGGGEDKTRRPDIVCFVNGIPFIVIECKSSTASGDMKPIDHAKSQQIRNQRSNEIPLLFHYAQILVAVSVNEARYAVTGTPSEYWHRWREREFDETNLQELVARIPTEQDKLLQSICNKKRLFDLTRHFNVFDDGNRKIARYQQYFCVKKCLVKFKKFDKDGRREGGIVWHTQGSGKSLTMGMLAEEVLRNFTNESPQIVIVTDRVDLSDQITDTFKKIQTEVIQANSGSHLDELLRDHRGRAIVTTIHKFEDFTNKNRSAIESPNIFVFVDEGHRTQTGSLHAAMRGALPKASFTGFTGTPILKGHKQTAIAFGGIIDTYTIADAVQDGAVVNLVYEGRYSEQHIEADPIDTWLEHHTYSLNEKHIQQLKQRYGGVSALNETEQRIRKQALDISLHFKTCFQSGETGFKAQLVCSSKSAAIKYKKHLDEIGLVSSELLISPPDTREGHTKVDDPDRPLIQEFWDKQMKEFGSEERYKKEVIRRFKKTDSPEIIIVVDMLLTGFDAPRNACLYLTRSLKGHTLLQAIARVNRVYRGKDHGLILDYYGVVKELDAAVDLYSTFNGEYDHEDLAGVLTDIRQAVEDLPDLHKAVWDCFKGVQVDREAQERYLEDSKAREAFYDALSLFSRMLKLAFGSEHFHATNNQERINKYRNDLKYFMDLRRSVAIRYAEIVDFGQYEASIRKLLDEHIGAEDPKTVVSPTTIFDESQFEQELLEFESTDAKAEVIANRVNRTIHEQMDKDPAFYRSLGSMLQEARDEYHEHRIGDTFLEAMEQLVSQIRERGNVDVCTTFNDLIQEVIGNSENVNVESSSVLAESIHAIIDRLSIVDWQNDIDLQNKMKIEMENEIFKWQESNNIKLDFSQIDLILDQSIDAVITRLRH